MAVKHYSLGILGYPLAHTLSPKLHQVLLELSGLSGTYERFEVAPAELADWVAGVKAQPEKLQGFDVTIPHKQAILPYLDRISPLAEALGAVNTVLVSPEGALYGDNTDITGFMASLPSTLKDVLAGSEALILGAGGSSRPVALALLQLGVASLTFWVRDISRAQPTVEALQRLNPHAVPIHAIDSLPGTLFLTTRLIVNTTPVGQYPHPGVSILSPEDLARFTQAPTVYDLIYNPRQTQLLLDASVLGFPIQNGLDMLIYQGAQAFEKWTGKPLNQDILSEINLSGIQG